MRGGGVLLFLSVVVGGGSTNENGSSNAARDGVERGGDIALSRNVLWSVRRPIISPNPFVI